VVLSLVEDAVAVGGSYSAVAYPLVLLGVVAVFLTLFLLLARRISRRFLKKSASPPDLK